MTRPIAGNPAAFFTQCPCGAEFRLSRTTLRKHQSAGTVPSCPTCTNRLRAAKSHGKRGGKYGPRVARELRRRKQCCEGMSWRRPKRGLCRCGQRYAPEQMPTLQDVMNEARGEARVYPIGGCR